LVCLLQQVDQITDNTSVAAIEESSRDSRVPSPPGTTDSVNVIIDVCGQIVVDNVGNIGDIKPTFEELVDD
jgi:hypothetical protein